MYILCRTKKGTNDSRPIRMKSLLLKKRIKSLFFFKIQTKKGEMKKMYWRRIL
jgi:hypothetical protein